jgi:hypothetical protein
MTVPDGKRFEFRLRHGDYVRFVAVMRRHTILRWLYWLVPVELVAVAGVIFALGRSVEITSARLGAAPFDAPEPWSLVAMAAAWAFGAPHLMSAIYRLGFRGLRVMVLGPDGVESGSDRRRRWYHWSVFRGVVETDELFVLLAGDGSMFLPKRALSGDAEVAAVGALLRQRIPGGAPRPSPSARVAGTTPLLALVVAVSACAGASDGPEASGSPTPDARVESAVDTVRPPAFCGYAFADTTAWTRQDEDGFSFLLPPGFERVEDVFGMDSQVGLWTRGDRRIFYDFGEFGSRLLPEDMRDIDGYRICPGRLNGAVRVVLFDPSGAPPRSAVGAFWADTSGLPFPTHLSLVASAGRGDSTAVAEYLSVLRSVRVRERAP